MKKSLLVLFIFLVACGGPAIAPTSTPLPSTNTSTPSLTPTFTPSPTSTLTPTATPIPNEITDEKGVIMRLVPAGDFTMGSDNGFDNEKPAHQVYLDAFYMDIYEVTNVLYRACVDAGGCNPPEDLHSQSRYFYYDDPKYDNYPMINVNWFQSQSYCEWRGGSLPTEAQWEKAARGTDGRTYPWGEEISCDNANYNRGGFFEQEHCVGDTTEVGSYESGKSPYGIYDMAGNVSEWVADWASDTYYQDSPSSNPLGPESGEYRVQRGGDWAINETFAATFTRFPNIPENGTIYRGFRCSRSLP